MLSAAYLTWDFSGSFLCEHAAGSLVSATFIHKKYEEFMWMPQSEVSYRLSIIYWAGFLKWCLSRVCWDFPDLSEWKQRLGCLCEVWRLVSIEMLPSLREAALHLRDIRCLLEGWQLSMQKWKRKKEKDQFWLCVGTLNMYAWDLCVGEKTARAITTHTKTANHLQFNTPTWLFLLSSSFFYSFFPLSLWLSSSWFPSSQRVHFNI